MPDEAPPLSGKIRIYLMGAPRVLQPRGGAQADAPLPIKQEDKAMELLALLILGREFLPPEGEDVRRDWLAELMYPSCTCAEDDWSKARDSVRHHRDRLNAVLPIIFPAQPGGARERERGVERVAWSGVNIDVLLIRNAARQRYKPEMEDKIIENGKRPLLDGASYPWLETAPFQEIRVRLDGYYLDALLDKSDRLLVQMEQANAARLLEDEAVYRNKAIPLLKKAAERLLGYSRLLKTDVYSPLLLRQDRYRLLMRRVGGHPFDTPSARLPQNARIQRPLTSFVGREDERQRVRQLLSSERLVTLTGTGGCGKTRLAEECAADLDESGGCEVRLIQLAGMEPESDGESDALPRRVLDSLGLETQGDSVEALIANLETKRVVLLLDNCEHRIGTCARLVKTLLQSCPQLKVLATSRELLNIDGEYPYPVLPLPTSDERYLESLKCSEGRTADAVDALLRNDSICLFLDRIRPYREFPLSPDDILVVANICTMLDGIPLALELAAARVEQLSLLKIREMLSDRFHLLTNGRRTALPHHKTLRALFDWSYDLLNEHEKALFCRLSVFRGGWTLEAAEVVGISEALSQPMVLDLMTSLASKSLILTNLTGASGRSGMLHTVQQYAEDQQRERGEWDETRNRHRDYYLALAEEAEQLTLGSQQKQWMDRLETEHDNFRAALSWRADVKSLQLACALQRFWWMRGYTEEGRGWLEREIIGPDKVPDELRSKSLIGVGRLAYVQGRYAEAKEMFQESLSIRKAMDLPGEIAEAQYNIADVECRQGNYDAAEELYRQSLSVFIEVHDQSGVRNAWAGLGMVAMNRQQFQDAEEYLQTSLTLRRQAEDLNGIAGSLACLGFIAHMQGNFQSARHLFEESLLLFEQLDNKIGLASTITQLGRVSMAEGDYKDAQSRFTRGLALMQTINNAWGTADALNFLGMLAYLQKDYKLAQERYDECLLWFDKIGNSRAVAAVLTNLAAVALAQKQYQQAGDLINNCLKRNRELQEKEWSATSLVQLASLKTILGDSRTAALLYGAAEALMESIGYQRPPSEIERYEEGVSATKATLGNDLFTSAWADGRAMSWQQSISYALGEGAIS